MACRWEGVVLGWDRWADGGACIELQATTVRAGRAEALFKLRGPFYQAARDGRRFLVSEMEMLREDWPMAVQLNWAGHLEK